MWSAPISNEMVRIYKEQFGRGPTKTRTDWAGPDVLVVTLEETFTPAERTLQRTGQASGAARPSPALSVRRADAFCEPVERLTGRKVRAFISGIDTEADLATEMFVLHPRGYDGPGAAEFASE